MTKRKKAGAHPASNARGKARAEHKQEGDLKPARMSGYGMLGELDRYCTARDATTGFMRSWARIRLHTTVRQAIILPCGRPMQRLSA